MADDYGAQPPAPPPAGSNVRIYVGNLPPDSSKRDLEQLFEKYGTLMDVSIKRTVSGSPFAFIEFEDERDAQEAIKGRDGYNFNGNRLRVEIPFASRSNGPNRGRGRAAPRRGEYRVEISGLPASGSWQDLKDHMRDAGECVYADVFRDGMGIVEFTRRDDWEYALKQFNDSKFRSHEGETSRIQVRVPDDMRDHSRRSPSPHSPHGREHYDGHRGAGRDEYRGGGGGYRDDNRSWGGHRDEYSSRGYRGDDRGGYRDDYRGAGASYRPDSRGGGGTLRYGNGGGGRYQDDMPPRYDNYRRDAPRHEEIPRGRSRSRSRR